LPGIAPVWHDLALIGHGPEAGVQIGERLVLDSRLA